MQSKNIHFTLTINLRELEGKVRKGAKGKGRPPQQFKDRTKYDRKKHKPQID